MLNDPFWLTREQAGTLTDRQANEWYLKRYPEEDDKKEAEDFDKKVQAELARREEEDKKKTLDRRKAEFFAYCKDMGGFTEVQIQAAWDEQTKG